VTVVNQNTPIIQTNFMSPWVFEVLRFYWKICGLIRETIFLPSGQNIRTLLY